MTNSVAPSAVVETATPPRRIPGEEGLWVFIFGDMTIFALLFGAFLVARGDDPSLFVASREHLSLAFGTANTLVLLTSSALIALSAQAFRAKRAAAAVQMIAGAELCALLFVAFKAFEWHDVLSEQPNAAGNPFYVYYFGLTGLHLLHLIVGSVGLILVGRSMRLPNKNSRFIIEAGSCYWHMVDLVWVVIFPLVYLASS
ncbi:cytochrome c oxidase subunit 3 [Mycolicibacterium sp. lyk4-40-TYG-92]|jgi:nitric oxide reductase NorE protein|uniref:cytochrome c oxidase subunit 3 n=1 Tax=Mycolicibacterium sp. lyk4-40-TYG-92 TaxID=3040295 RepID=UPI00254EE5CF|nr:cytochrome c oxidase subunit 3 [Mycolicibacterium sp. lyk4-40-TYG-92]